MKYLLSVAYSEHFIGCFSRLTEAPQINVWKRFSHNTLSAKATSKRFRDAAVVTVAIVFISEEIIRSELRRFGKSLSFQQNVCNNEKQLSPYIYCDPLTANKHESSQVENSYQQIFKHFIEGKLLQQTSALIGFTKSSNESLRRWTVLILSRGCSKWTDAEYQSIAQAIDLRTKLELARCRSTNIKLFLAPPLLPISKESVDAELYALVTSLPIDSVSRCTKYFIDLIRHYGIRALSADQRRAIWNFEACEWPSESSTHESEQTVLLLYLLQALLGHCQSDANSRTAVSRGALITLRRLIEDPQCKTSVLYGVARIMASLSSVTGLHEELNRTGWLTILAKWIRSSDLALSLMAGKALANLHASYISENSKTEEQQESRPIMYKDGVYLYYPMMPGLSTKEFEADVIFLHGLRGGPFKTWRQKDRPSTAKANGNSKSVNEGDSAKDGCTNISEVSSAQDPESSCAAKEPQSSAGNSYTRCWPKDWLSADVPNARILSLEFETSFTAWNSSCPYDHDNRTLEGRATELLAKLKAAGVGQRPVIWVCHSMGGLVMKQILCLALRNMTNSSSENSTEAAGCNSSSNGLVEQTKGCVFYSVPHQGSSLMTYTHFTVLYPSVEVKELVPGSVKLKLLHDSFKELVKSRNIPVLSFAEGQDMPFLFKFSTKIVSEESSDPGVGEFYIMPRLNHLNVCKPEGQSDELYQQTVGFIQRCLHGPAS